MNNNEIILKEIKNIAKEVKDLTQNNWIKITNKHLNNVNFIVCKTKCEVIKGSYMILKTSPALSWLQP